MNSEERKRLEELKAESSLNPDVQRIKSGTWIKHVVGSKDDDAGLGCCWKEYWQAFTLQDFPTRCPFCNEDLKADDISGCHIKIEKPRDCVASKSWTTMKYIIPGHQACNVDDESECQAQIDIVAVEAIKKN